ncbi:HD-GYP domain-containing protein [Metabacillus iocasae]|uniref:HD-GYP domain-containing protein (C-di-GMP phosphodiesterase class II) n=1 Tax=Priestia iocasae TaxID=2291674 RepID=A0ABS2QZB7_9BACI|nr:HD-GYP domain-containing protein [Metabacillus iocasae]MBM7704588.1 HD-GYP domain-containing protein (c-di-GMP phosphodiesterase class II) [Metabacillus iocasae]
MKLVAVEFLKPGVFLGKPIYNEQGNVLVNQGIMLTTTIIKRLKLLGISFVYIQDERMKDITFHASVISEVRNRAINTVQDSFLKLKNQPSGRKQISLFEQSVKEITRISDEFVKDLTSDDDVLSLLTDVYVYDNYVFSHSVNVTLYALALGIELRLSQKELEKLGVGGMLHDVGKMFIPNEILNKPGKLTNEEFAMVKKHTTYGFDLLKAMPTVSIISAYCAQQHHERLDGTGYPYGLKGEQIHYFSKILAIADVYDAVTSHRVYRKALLPHEALEILYAGAGTHFDRDMVEAFRKAIIIYPIGLGVTLNDGRKGVVVGQNKGISDRPIVRILEENENELHEPYDLDLKEHMDILVTASETTI